MLWGEPGRRWVWVLLFVAGLPGGVEMAELALMVLFLLAGSAGFDRLKPNSNGVRNAAVASIVAAAPQLAGVKRRLVVLIAWLQLRGQ